jgi:hypothetical protein
MFGHLADRSGLPVGGVGYSEGLAKPKSAASNNLVTGCAPAAALLPACRMS